MAYTFTCPLEGCDHTVMKSESNDTNTAAKELTATAEKHLRDVHPQLHKTHDEVNQDIRAHMTSQE